jgi:predicted DNA-binding ribbon-helix-helix protein
VTQTFSDDEVPQRGPRKRSLSVQGRPTSVSLTDEMWQEFRDCAAREKLSVNQLVSRIKSRNPGNLNRAIRLHIINERMSETGNNK